MYICIYVYVYIYVYTCDIYTHTQKHTITHTHYTHIIMCPYMFATKKTQFSEAAVPR